MADERQERGQIKYDAGGFDVLTDAIRALVNQFPGLAEGETVAFATLRENGGMAMFPGDGAAVQQERRSVTGRVRQVCRYPFVVLYRRTGFTEQSRADEKERLDALGRWLGRQPVRVNGRSVRLESYPALGEGRRLLDFSVQAPAYLHERDEHQAETWAAGFAAEYENIFYL